MRGHWVKVGFIFLFSTMMCGPQSVRASEGVCGSLADVTSGFVAMEICQNHVGFWQEQHEIVLKQAMDRSMNPQELLEDERHFQDSLRRCGDSECVRVAYVEQSQRLDSVADVAELAQKTLEDNSANFATEKSDMGGSGGPVSTISATDAGSDYSGTTSQDDLTLARDTPVQPLARVPSVADELGQVATSEGPHAEPQVSATEGRRSTWSNQVLILSFWGVLGCAVVLMLMAATNQVVVFYDGADAFWSIAPFAFLLIGLMVSTSMAPEGAEQFASTFLEKVVVGIAALASIFAVIVNYRNAIHYNRSVVLGVMVGTLKLCISTFMALTVFGQLGKLMDSGSTRRQFNGAILILMMVGVLWRVLINGRRVHENRGWLLEQPA